VEYSSSAVRDILKNIGVNTLGSNREWACAITGMKVQIVFQQV
jgi:hypothetical protein